MQIKQDIVEQSFDQIGRAILWDKRIDNQVLKYVEFQEGHFCHVEPIIPSVKLVLLILHEYLYLKSSRSSTAIVLKMIYHVVMELMVKKPLDFI